MGTVLYSLPAETVTVEVHPSQLYPTIGDSLSIFCTVTAPEDVHLSEPYLVSTSPFIDIERKWEKAEFPDSGTRKEQFGFLVYVLSPDTVSVGPFSIDFITAEGDTGTVSSDIITLHSKGIIENNESAVMPNRSPFEIPSGGIPLWLTALLLFILAVTAVCIMYYIRKKKCIVTQHSPPVPINEIGEFERIRALKLHEKGELKKLYILTSNAMREFIHRNMNLDALYRTSEEIITTLSRNSVGQKITEPIQEILEESDMVKFAKYLPPADLSSSIIDRALDPVKAVIEEIEREKEKLTAEQETTNHSEDKGKVFSGTTMKQTGGNS